jgi:uncharacterized membrane protein
MKVYMIMSSKTVQRRRHLAKAATWRVIATSTTFAVSWFFTNDVNFSAGIATVDSCLKFFFYYFHERTWLESKWGVVERE